LKCVLLVPGWLGSLGTPRGWTKMIENGSTQNPWSCYSCTKKQCLNVDHSSNWCGHTRYCHTHRESCLRHRKGGTVLQGTSVDSNACRVIHWAGRPYPAAATAVDAYWKGKRFAVSFAQCAARWAANRTHEPDFGFADANPWIWPEGRTKPCPHLCLSLVLTCLSRTRDFACLGAILKPVARGSQFIHLLTQRACERDPPILLCQAASQ